MEINDYIMSLQHNIPLLESANPIKKFKVTHKLQQIALTYCLYQTRHLEGEERLEKKKELLVAASEQIQSLIESLERVAQYKPMKILGFKVTSDSIISVITFYISLCTGLIIQFYL